jgi:hypothetical protein
VLSKSDFLKDGLIAAPYIGAAVSFLDAFFGGGKTESVQQVQMMPMAINMTTTYTGTITAPFTKRQVTIDNPGSKDAGLPPFATEDYPAYNEIMGNLSVMTLPKLKVRTSRVTYRFPNGGGIGTSNISYAKTYSLMNPLTNEMFLALNPASGLDPAKIEVRAALLFEFDNTDTQLHRPLNANMELEAKTPTAIRYRTPYIQAACFTEYTTTTAFRTGDSLKAYYSSGTTLGDVIVNFQSPKAVYLKLVVNLKRLNATPTTQNVLYVQTFKLNNTVEETEHINMNVIPPCNNCIYPLPAPTMPSIYSTSNYRENIVFRTGQTIDATQTVATKYIWGSLIVQPGVNYIGTQNYPVWCPGGVIYEDGATPLPANIYPFPYPYPCMGTIYMPPAPQSFIQSACATTYKNQSQRWSKAEKEEQQAANEAIKESIAETEVLSIYPNPAQNEATIRYQVQQAGRAKLTITNTVGVVVQTLIDNERHEEGSFAIRFSTEQLPSGIYLYSLATETGIKTQKLVIAK